MAKTKVGENGGMAVAEAEPPKKSGRPPGPPKPDKVEYEHELPLVELPKDYDSNKHTPLKKGDFEKEEFYYEMRAVVYDKYASGMRRKAEEAKRMGSMTDRTKAKRLLRIQSQMATLREQLEADGVNVDELLGN